MPTRGNTWLKLGALLSFAIALLHFIIIFIGAQAYRYFRAGEKMANMAEAGSFVPALITFALVFAFTIFGCYALSGASVIRRLPLLLPALVIIGAFYTLRGIGAPLQIIFLMSGPTIIETRDAVFSSVALLAGISHLTGTILNWRILKTRPSALQAAV